MNYDTYMDDELASKSISFIRHMVEIEKNSQKGWLVLDLELEEVTGDDVITR